MKKLMNKDDCYFVYDESNDIIFQSAIKQDVCEFLNRELICLDFEKPSCMQILQDLHQIPGKVFKGYWRMYFRDGNWNGRWFGSENGKLSDLEIYGLNNISQYISERWPNGCSFDMQDDVINNFDDCKIGEYRYYVKPMASNNYILMLDLRYKNEDYPVRIYVYE